MLTAIRSILLLDDPVKQPIAPMHWKLSALRIFLAITLLLCGSMCIHLIVIAGAKGLVKDIVVVLIFMSAGAAMWWLSWHYPRPANIFLTATAYCSGATMVLFNGIPEVMRMGVVYLNIVPLFCWIFFGWRSTVALMAVNAIPFTYLLLHPEPIMLFGLDLSMPYSLEYVHIMIFVYFNLAMPAALLRVRKALDNITQQHATALTELQAASSLYLDTFEFSGNATLICDEAGQIIHANQQASGLFGRDLETEKPMLPELLHASALGRTPWSLLPLSDLHAFTEAYSLGKHGNAATWVRISAKPMATHYHYLVTLTDVTALYEAEQAYLRSEQRALYLEYHDALTGLPNQKLFEQRLSEYCESVRTDSAKGCILLCVRLNNIRQINDRFGVAIGNKVIQKLGQILVQITGVQACTARLRGLIFATMFPVRSMASDSTAQIHALVDALPQFLDVDGHQISVAYSVGAMLDDDHIHSANDLLRMVERTLDEARNLSGNSLTLLSPHLKDKIHREALLENALLEAIDAHELLLHYQPKVDRDGRIECAEALLRWNSSKLGSVSPAEFIPLAERCGMIRAITRHVIELVCKQQQEWRQKGHALVPIAINLSGQDLHDGQITPLLLDAINRHQLSAQLIQIEITETALIDNEALALKQLQDLRSQGYELALDDFGTGHSSLSKLSEYPFTIIKIDRSFIHGIGHHGRREQIVKATLSLAHALKCKSVAEGVETAEQFNFLQAHGCDLFQGYFFHRPMPAADLEQLLLKQANT